MAPDRLASRLAARSYTYSPECPENFDGSNSQTERAAVEGYSVDIVLIFVGRCGALPKPRPFITAKLDKAPKRMEFEAVNASW
ncbi:hypothetical protein DSM21852_09650 [Methylocystis bryophila]|nr:hypothetical protein DSM21852_09650 [Methylocystis bryophila]